MKPVTFTRYVPPDGRKVPGHFNLPNEVADKAHALQELGLGFELELLRTNEASLTLVGDNEEGERDDLDIEVVANAPDAVKSAAERLIERAHAQHCRSAA